MATNKKRKLYGREDQKTAFQYLRSINNAVLLICEKNEITSRIRLVEPDGRCYWDTMEPCFTETAFVNSCFWDYGMSRDELITEMENYNNKYNIQIQEIIDI